MKVCIKTQVRIYGDTEPEPSGNPLGSALGISLVLGLYFIVYPSSRHNTDTVHSTQKYIFVSNSSHPKPFYCYFINQLMEDVLSSGWAAKYLKGLAFLSLLCNQMWFQTDNCDQTHPFGTMFFNIHFQPYSTSLPTNCYIHTPPKWVHVSWNISKYMIHLLHI